MEIRLCVIVCLGVLNSVFISFCSIILFCDIIVMLFVRCVIMFILWVISSIFGVCFCIMFFSRSRMCVCVIMSRSVVGLSAMINGDLYSIVIVIIMCCNMLSFISNGYSFSMCVVFFSFIVFMVVVSVVLSVGFFNVR